MDRSTNRRHFGSSVIPSTAKMQKRRRYAGAIAAAAIAAIVPVVHAGTVFTSGGLTLNENFDSMGTTATGGDGVAVVSTTPTGWVGDTQPGTATSNYDAA